MARTNPPNLIADALRAAARGWPVFPLRPYAKVPAIHGWERSASTDPQRLHAWWTATPAANIGLACGPAGLMVVDLDAIGHDTPIAGDGCRHGRDELQDMAVRSGAHVPDTYTVATPSGEHLYFLAQTGSGARNTVAKLGSRIDTRAAGGYVVAAGSLLRRGNHIRRYQVLRDVPVTPFPAWLAAALDGPVGRSQDRIAYAVGESSAYVAAALAGEAAAVASARPGVRNHTLFRAAANLGGLAAAGLLDPVAAATALLDAAAGHIGVQDFTEDEARRTIANGIRRGSRHPRHSCT